MTRLFFALSVCFIGGCASLAGDIGLVAQSFMLSGKQPSLPTFSNGLNPAFRYLYVKPDDGIAAIFVMGSEKATPNGLLETWYSADGVFLSTLDGRLSATSGYKAGWVLSRWQWTGRHLLRIRDVAGRGPSGVVDQVQTQYPEPIGNLPASLFEWLVSLSVPASQLAWQSDEYLTTPPSQGLPKAWLAFGWHRGMFTMVASRQCMGVNHCFHLARWPLDHIRISTP